MRTKNLLAAAMIFATTGAAFGQSMSENCSGLDTSPSNTILVGTAVTGNFTGSTNDGPIPGSGSCGEETGNLTQWWLFVPPATGQYTLSMCGSAHGDSILAIQLASDACSGTVPYIACSDDACGLAAQVVTTLTGGVSYRLRASTFGAISNGGGYSILVTQQGVAAPAGDDCALPITAITGTNAGSLVGATGSLNLNSCGGTVDFNDVYYTYTATVSGAHRFSVCTGDFDAVLSVHNACPIDASTTNQIASACATSADAPVLQCSGRGATLSTTLVSGTTYTVRVAGASDQSTTTSTGAPFVGFGAFNLLIAQPAPPPANDTCATAIDLNAAGFPFSTSIDNSNAGDDVDIGTCNTGTVTTAGVWFTYTAAANGSLSFTETGGQDVAWGIFTSNDCGALGTSSLCTGTDANGFFTVTAGTTYKILVGATSSSTARTTPMALAFNFIPPATNDDCATAIELSVAGGSLTAAAMAATTDPDVTCNTSSAPGAVAGVWYHINLGLDSGSLVVSETGSEDVVIVVFSGSCGSLTQVTCTDAESNITTALSANTDYYLMIAKWGTTQPTTPYAITYSVTGIQTGACCVGANCQILSAGNCAGQSGTYFGNNTVCGAGNPNASDTAISAIPDGTDTGAVIGTLTRTINVTDTGTISSIDVVTGLTHSWCGDLRLTLISPANIAMVLVERPSTPACAAPFTAAADNSNYGGTYRFSDTGSTQTLVAAAAAVGDVVIPSGTYQAASCGGAINSLNGAFGGQTMTGTWTLTVEDLDQGDTGTLNGWSLVINGGVTNSCDTGPTPCEIADFNGAGGVTADDIFAFLDAWFAQNGQTGANLSADANNDDAVTADDIFFFLDLWFTYNGQTCP